MNWKERCEVVNACMFELCVLNPRSVVQSCAGTAVGDEKFGGVAAVVGCDWLVVNFRRRPLNSGDESLLQIYFYLNSNQRVIAPKTT